MRKPDPLFVPFRGREVRVRHDDPALGPYTPMAVVLRSATSVASDVAGLRLALETTVGDRYGIEVPDDGSEVRLRRRTLEEALAGTSFSLSHRVVRDRRVADPR